MMNRDELIRKLRQLKKQEVAIRFCHRPMREGDHLIWSEFFSTNEHASDVAYPLPMLLTMDHLMRKEVFDCLFFAIYHQYYKENGLPLTDLFERESLEALGLSSAATAEDVKKRFKELAKLHHPDKGGESTVFIEILEAYEKLKRNFTS